MRTRKQNLLWAAVFLVIATMYTVRVVQVLPMIAYTGDFSTFHLAGTLINQQQYDVLYNVPQLKNADCQRAWHIWRERQDDITKYRCSTMTFLYPPLFYVYVQAMAWVNAATAYVLWTLLSLAGTLYACWLWTRHAAAPYYRYFLPFMLSSAVLHTLTIGQNGLFIASLLLIGLYHVPTHAWRAGLLLSLTACKPQFGALVALFLLCRGQYRASAGFVLGLAAQVLLTLWLYGAAPWHAFFISSQKMMHEYLPAYRTYFNLDLVVSFYTFMQDAGVPHTAALRLQTLWTIMLLTLLVFHVRRMSNYTHACALLLLTMFLALPYVLMYDGVYFTWGILLWASTVRDIKQLAQQKIFAAAALFACYHEAIFYHRSVLFVVVSLLFIWLCRYTRRGEVGRFG